MVSVAFLRSSVGTRGEGSRTHAKHECGGYDFHSLGCTVSYKFMGENFPANKDIIEA